MISSIFKWAGINKWMLIVIGGLVLSNFISGKLLLSAHKNNGVLDEKVSKLKSKNNQLATAHDSRVDEFKKLQAKWLQRDIKKENSNTKLNERLNEAKDIKDETNVRDIALPDLYRLLIEGGANNQRLPVSESSATKSDENTSTNSDGNSG
ncbi:hypothetical protein N9Y67_00155 [Pseudomonadota bacterium]|nr:hypothetical protein [Pseudomonadota bacterium]